jgi:mannose-6-phosphate isomerase-like protein (cupin superfamily)
MVALNDFTPLQGGIPIVVDGTIIGAVGVSGAASADQDTQLAVAGSNAFANPSMQIGETKGMDPAVVFFATDQVNAAFAKGVPLIEQYNYKIHASRRETQGMVEVHTKDTDLIYVLQGSATFITGGTMLDGKETAPNEIRGASIQGGETRELKKGDVIIVPNGTPHWFKQVKGPFLYYTVKVS